MRRTGNLKERITDLDNLYLAYVKASRGKYCKREVSEFRADFENRIRRLKATMEDGTVTVGDYHYFTIRDPKERVICAASFDERVLHHAIMNVCHEYFDRTLIDTTFATRRGKGVYAAIDYARKSLRNYSHVVKLDFRKYYDSISHEVLYGKLCRLFKDKWLLALFARITDSYEVSAGYGLPIGNLTSQYFANTYLSSLDHFIKQDLHIPAYARYMDDMLLACNSRRELKEAVRRLTEYSTENLGLTLKAPVFRDSASGIDFLGYKVYAHHLELTGRSKKRFRSKMAKYNSLLNGGRWSEDEYRRHVEPLLSFTEYADCVRFRSSLKFIE